MLNTRLFLVCTLIVAMTVHANIHSCCNESELALQKKLTTALIKNDKPKVLNILLTQSPANLNFNVKDHCPPDMQIGSYTPLEVALLKKQPLIARRLLEKGADPRIYYASAPPLQVAFLHGYYRAAGIMLKMGAGLQKIVLNPASDTPKKISLDTHLLQYYTLRESNHLAAEVLIRHTASINQALVAATIEGREDVQEFFIAHGADKTWVQKTRDELAKKVVQKNLALEVIKQNEPAHYAEEKEVSI